MNAVCAQGSLNEVGGRVIGKLQHGAYKLGLLLVHLVITSDELGRRLS